MKTKRKNKKKNQPDNGGFTTGCGMIAFILPSIRSQYTSIFHTLSQRRLPAFSTLHSSHRSNRMPAFQPFASCRHFRADASIFHAAAAIRLAVPAAHGVHMYACVQRVLLLSVVWRIPPPWDHVYIVFKRAFMSRRRRRGV